MKEVKIQIPTEKMEVVVELFDKLGIRSSTLIHEENATIITVVEINQTATLLEELKGLGIGAVFGSILLSPVDLEIDSTPEKLVIKSSSISIDEMVFATKGLAIISPTFLVLCIIAGALASFGLIYDNVVIIIASMIIAPLLGPIALAVIGTMIAKNIYSKRAFLAEAVGLGTCILIGALVGLIFSGKLTSIPEGSQIGIRTTPGIGDIVFAILSGLAAGIFIVRGESTNIVGVAVAASLCPPATNIGVLLSNAYWEEAFGSIILLVLNVIAIYSACAIIFWTSQSLVRGGSVSKRQFRQISRKYIVRIILAVLSLVAIILLIIFVYEIPS